PAGLTDAQRDDGYFDETFFCSNTCEVQCTPSADRGATWKGGAACIFVAEADDQLDDADGNTYTNHQLGWTAAEQHCRDYGIGAHLATARMGSVNGGTDNAALAN